MSARRGGPYWAPFHHLSCWQATETPKETLMAILAPELSIGGLTALLCAISAMLVPLTIWVFYSLERQKSDRWLRRAQKPSGRCSTRA